MAKAKPVHHASARSVTVACKIPTGLALQLQKEQPRIVDTPQGPKSVNFWVKGGKTFYVHGPAYPVSPPPGYPRAPVIEGGYAMTPGIPVEFWNDWLEQNSLADYVTSDMIYAMPSMEDAMAWAREREELLSGMEPLSQEVDASGRLKDPRAPRPINQQIMRLAKEPHPGGGETSITEPA